MLPYKTLAESIGKTLTGFVKSYNSCDDQWLLVFGNSFACFMSGVDDDCAYMHEEKLTMVESITLYYKKNEVLASGVLSQEDYDKLEAQKAECVRVLVEEEKINELKELARLKAKYES